MRVGDVEEGRKIAGPHATTSTALGEEWGGRARERAFVRVARFIDEAWREFLGVPSLVRVTASRSGSGRLARAWGL